MSIWEIGINLPGPFEEYVERIKAAYKVRIVAVDEHIWMENVALNWGYKDPVDHTIVATAQIYQYHLVTPAHVIQDFYKKSIW